MAEKKDLKDLMMVETKVVKWAILMVGLMVAAKAAN